MLFSEIYGAYYRAVGELINLAVEGKLDKKIFDKTLSEKAFGESRPVISANLIDIQRENQKSTKRTKEDFWQLLRSDFSTPCKHRYSLPLTYLEKRWLKAISLDKRFSLFGIELPELEGIKPLFTPDMVDIFDRNNDGDNYDDEKYRAKFRKILDAINNGRETQIDYVSNYGNSYTVTCVPYSLEYSEKDDRFRVRTSESKKSSMLKMSNIVDCRITDVNTAEKREREINERAFVLELTDERHALERVMLQFAHFRKKAEKIGENLYRLTVWYERDDETELVIRVLSCGQFAKAVSPVGFVALVRERLIRQSRYELK